MAFLDATLLNDYQARAALNEKRFVPHGVIDLVKDSTPLVKFIPSDAKERLKTVSGMRNVDIPVIKDQQVQVVTTPGFNFIPDNLTESDKYNFTVYDVFSGFRHYPAHYENNMVGAMEDFEAKMDIVLNEMANTIEGIALSVMDTRRTQLLDYETQISQGSLGGTYTFDGVGDTLNVNKAAQQETIFSDLSELMSANKLPGQYSIVTSPAGLAVQKKEALLYGSSNDKNIAALGMIPASDMHTSHNISPNTDVFTGYWVRKGDIGIYENHPYDFRTNTTVNGKTWSVTDVEMPMVRMRLNVYTNQFATNAESLVQTGTDSNLTMTKGEEIAMWARFYVVYSYNSDLTTRPQGIVKLRGLTS